MDVLYAAASRDSKVGDFAALKSSLSLALPWWLRARSTHTLGKIAREYRIAQVGTAWPVGDYAPEARTLHHGSRPTNDEARIRLCNLIDL